MSLLRALLAVLLLCISGVILVALRTLRADPKQLTALSALAACLSSLVALLIAHLNQARENERKQAERTRSEAAEREKRTTLTRVYKAEIDIWLDRRELKDVAAAVTDAMGQFEVAGDATKFFYQAWKAQDSPNAVNEAVANARMLFQQPLLRRGLFQKPVRRWWT